MKVPQAIIAPPIVAVAPIVRVPPTAAPTTIVTEPTTLKKPEIMPGLPPSTRHAGSMPSASSKSIGFPYAYAYWLPGWSTGSGERKRPTLGSSTRAPSRKKGPKAGRFSKRPAPASGPNAASTPKGW